MTTSCGEARDSIQLTPVFGQLRLACEQCAKLFLPLVSDCLCTRCILERTEKHGIFAHCHVCNTVSLLGGGDDCSYLCILILPTWPGHAPTHSNAYQRIAKHEATSDTALGSWPLAFPTHGSSEPKASCSGLWLFLFQPLNPFNIL